MKPANPNPSRIVSNVAYFHPTELDRDFAAFARIVLNWAKTFFIGPKQSILFRKDERHVMDLLDWKTISILMI